ncbi:DUF2243 domain-containing protein [uncultured Enterovirga sp.]|uniref:DUF2243 domain-containing protein n=1 Tax=uncultured Enterovirga sp. TaxID=2026352 RepID=UPI0035CB525B
MATNDTSRAAGPSPTVAAGVLGFALGGFIDGILLHQVLQWHHLLSLVGGEGLRDIRVQILADGLFHVLMYVIALGGLWLLWRSRDRITGRRDDLRIVGSAFLGFGVWQVVDVVGFHWVMGIHRIRVDVPNPLFWDIAWLVVFAVPSLAAAWWLMRKTGHDGPSGPGLRRAPAALAALVVVAGPVAILPPPGVSTAMVVFRSGIDAPAAFAAVAAVDGRVLWSSRNGDVLAVDLGGRSPAALYANGALLVSSSSLVAGCLAWSRV